MTKLLTVLDADGAGRIDNLPDPLAAGEAARKSYVDARDGSTYLASYGDSTPAVVFDLPAGVLLKGISVVVTQLWAAAGASVEIGVVGEPDRYFDSTESDLTELATYAKEFSELGPRQIIITITPGSTPTPTGEVRLQISTLPIGT